jgi:malate dehydrogenase (oxaloacetate-decarboxylating)(NADP+)
LDASVDEIVNMTAIAVIDAQKKQKREQLSKGLN